MISTIQLTDIINLSIEAGKAILEVYEQDFDVESKSDDSPLTMADKHSNEVIVRKLKELYPDIPIISEEIRNLPYEERKNWAQCWLVDPLDGTKEFIKRNGEFTVNIAFIDEGIPAMGVIYVPVKDVIYVGSKDGGAYRIDNAMQETLNDDIQIADLGHRLPMDKGNRPYTIVGSRSHMSDETMEFVNAQKAQHGEAEMLSVGSSLKFCMVAEGKADVYPRFAPTMEWDTGAGQAIAEAAGFVVTRHDNDQPLRYNKENLLNPWFVVRPA